MFSKKEKKEDYCYTRARELRNQISNSWSILASAAKDAYLASIAMNCFLKDTPDYNNALFKLQEAQQKVRCKIGAYDSSVATYNNYLKQNELELVCKSEWTYWKTDSYDVILYELKNFIRND